MLHTLQKLFQGNQCSGSKDRLFLRTTAIETVVHLIQLSVSIREELKGQLMGMMIYVLVYIVGLKCI